MVLCFSDFLTAFNGFESCRVTYKQINDDSVLAHNWISYNEQFNFSKSFRSIMLGYVDGVRSGSVVIVR